MSRKKRKGKVSRTSKPKPLTGRARERAAIRTLRGYNVQLSLDLEPKGQIDLFKKSVKAARVINPKLVLAPPHQRKNFMAATHIGKPVAGAARNICRDRSVRRAVLLKNSRGGHAAKGSTKSKVTCK